MKPLLYHALTALPFAVGAFAVGCHPSSPTEVAEPVMTADESKSALVSLTGTTTDDDLKRFLPALRAATPEVDAESKLLIIGPARVNPEAKTFTLSVVSPHGFIEYAGKFIRREGGWVAEVETKRQT